MCKHIKTYKQKGGLLKVGEGMTNKKTKNLHLLAEDNDRGKLVNLHGKRVSHFSIWDREKPSL